MYPFHTWVDELPLFLASGGFGVGGFKIQATGGIWELATGNVHSSQSLAFQRWKRWRGLAYVVRTMFSHVVIFWTDPANPAAADELVAGGQKYLKSIPGALQFHMGKMVGSHRPVVDQSYQVALNLIFPDKQAQDDYQVHPEHLKFVAECSKLWKKVTVYDFA